jgi:hypothetical protein
MRNCLVLAAALLLGSSLPMEAQAPVTHVSLAQTSPSFTMTPIVTTTPRVLRAGLWSVVPHAELPAKPLPHVTFVFDGRYKFGEAYKPEPSLESRLPIEVDRTAFLTESNYMVTHLWGGLELEGFDSTLHSQGAQLGSPTSASGLQGFAPSRHDQAGITDSLGSYGISLRYTIGQHAEIRKTMPIWRCMSWVIGDGRGCSL